ncbi:MAG TPA: response regulator [Candidatus Acidoferrales bacterium]|nr:response regulator [Candidatus Acidoferrales bacterium]
MARKILLADDSVTAQNMGRKILADAGYEVITVNNGSAALKRISEQRPDLIVLDVYMPGYSGLEVCQRLKEVNETARIPILLTVGKLEPFKPEEARRVRADAFIVKPFEASELLSALSKLEDKIVPRAESSKPGRFARATAAIEEGQRDGTAPAEADSGWKSRISFPKKRKKEEPVEANADDPSIYNAVNKDLRTVVEHSRPAGPEAVPEQRVDLGALAPGGLPKDVTPEEIAALAAAAAQMQGRIVESNAPEAKAVSEPDKHSQETVLATPAATSEADPAAPAEQAASAHAATSAPFEESKDVSSSIPGVEETPVTAAVAVREESEASGESHSGDGPWLQAAASQQEPVTMAAAAGADSVAARWTAVAVAPETEETTASLEAEMQRAYAALAAEAPPENSAVVAKVEPAVSEPEAESKATESSHVEPVASKVAEPVAAESAVAEDASPVPAIEPVIREAAIEPASPASVVVKEFETVSAAYVPDNGPTPDSFSGTLEAPAVPVVESTQSTEAAPETPSLSVPEPVAQQSLSSESAVPEISQAVSEMPASNASSIETSAEHPPVAAEPVSAAETDLVSSESHEVGPSEPTGGGDDMAKKESDIAATTAAAWASWRKIRESGGSHSAQPESSSQAKPDSGDEAAMAVAAGAEKTPEETAAESDAEISSIVDSVLADLRPRIAEEISRKLGKKK